MGSLKKVQHICGSLGASAIHVKQDELLYRKPDLNNHDQQRLEGSKPQYLAPERVRETDRVCLLWGVDHAVEAALEGLQAKARNLEKVSLPLGQLFTGEIVEGDLVQTCRKFSGAKVNSTTPLGPFFAALFPRLITGTYSLGATI